MGHSGLFYPLVVMLEHCAPPGSALVRDRKTWFKLGSSCSHVTKYLYGTQGRIIRKLQTSKLMMEQCSDGLN